MLPNHYLLIEKLDHMEDMGEVVVRKFPWTRVAGRLDNMGIVCTYGEEIAFNHLFGVDWSASFISSIYEEGDHAYISLLRMRGDREKAEEELTLAYLKYL